MKNICFIANFYKTPTDSAVAQNLKNHGIDSFWLVPKKKQYEEIKKTFGDEKVMLIDRSYINKKSEPVGDYKINEIIYGDRVWRYEIDNGIKYLTNIQKPICKFIKKNNIKMVFGEDTWAQELLIHRMCLQNKELDCRFVSEMVARVPNGRFFFFSDEKQVNFIPRRSDFDETPVETIKVERPAYLFKNNQLNKNKRSFRGHLNQLKCFLTGENIEPTDSNVLVNKWTRFKVRTAEIIHQKTYFFVKRTKPEDVLNLKYVFFGFHMQPEASVDVCGRYFENQFDNVINLWRQLPPDWYLVIKEHSNAIGNRGYSFYKEFEKYPRIIIVNEYANSQELIKHAQLVATNTGTMGLESALMGVPAITFSKVIFNCLNYCRRCTWQDLEKYNSLKDLVDEIKSLPNNKDEFTRIVSENSYVGSLTDVVSDASVLNDENISQVTMAFVSLLKNG